MKSVFHISSRFLAMSDLFQTISCVSYDISNTYKKNCYYQGLLDVKSFLKTDTTPVFRRNKHPEIKIVPSAIEKNIIPKF